MLGVGHCCGFTNIANFFESDSCIHSIWKTCNFINIVTMRRNFCAHIFWEFVQIFDKSKFLVVRFHPLYRQLLTSLSNAVRSLFRRLYMKPRSPTFLLTFVTASLQTIIKHASVKSLLVRAKGLYKKHPHFKPMHRLHAGPEFLSFFQ